MRTFARLQARDELDKGANDPVTDVMFFPLFFARVLFTLVQHERLEDVARDGIAGKVEVAVSKCFQDGKRLFSPAKSKETVFSLEK